MERPDGTRMEIVGSGGGQVVADSLTRSIGSPVPLFGQIPLETQLRECGDADRPILLARPDSPSAEALEAVSDKLIIRARGLGGISLGLAPVRT